MNWRVDIEAEDDDLGDVVERSLKVVGSDFHVSKFVGIGSPLTWGQHKLSIVLAILAYHLTINRVSSPEYLYYEMCTQILALFDKI